jgi:hypothetical protein
MDSSLKYGPVENIVFREEEEGAFLFDPETGNLRYMNLSGRQTYLMLNGRNDVERVVRHLSELYPEVELPRLKQDVEAFVMDLEKEKFILRLPEDSSGRVV